MIERFKRLKNQRWFRWLQNGWIVFVALFVVITLLSGGKQLSSLKFHLDLGSVVVIGLISILIRIIAAFIWAILIKAVTPREQHIPLTEDLYIFSLSSLAAYIPGTYWSLVGRAQMYYSRGVSIGRSSVATLLETILMVLSGTLFTVSLPLFLPQLTSSQKELWTVVLGLVCLGLLVLLYPPFIERLVMLAARLLKRQVVSIRVSYRSLLLGLVLFASIWWLLGVAAYLIIQMLSPLPSNLDVWSSAAFYSVSWIVAFFAPFAPAGIGVREAAFVALLVNFIPVSIATAAAILIRVFTSLGVILVGVIAYLVPRMKLQLNHQS